MTMYFFKSYHLDILKSWFESYGLNTNCELPRIGFISIDDDEPLAAGFLRRVEGNYGLFDGLIANPKSFGKRRNKALNDVVAALIEEARRLEITKILAYSADTAVVRRSLRHGFELQPDSFIALAV